MDNYVTRNNFLDLAEDVRLLAFLEFSRRIRRMLSVGKHFGFDMLSSFVACALLILIFSRLCRCYMILLWLRCPLEIEKDMVFHCLRKHRSEFAQNNWLLSVVNTFISILSAPIYFRDGLTLRILGECHNCAAKPLFPSFKPFWFQVSLPFVVPVMISNM